MKTQKMNGNSHDTQAELLAKLQKEMPEVFSEGKIDFSKFKATLGEDSVAEGERYGLSWAGKSDCFRQIQETTTNTLKPCREESVNFDNTDNLFIEGDNLQAMKVLQKSYYGKVKMIYIDPPYNTGNDFIYNDKFSQAKKEYLQEIGAIDELGNVVNAELFRQNTRDSGHFHSTWLNMMYPRLFLARNLLRQDGVIFVSIDDNEVANLRKMMDEIFGEEGFVAIFPWRKRTAKSDVPFGVSQDYEWVMAYGKSSFLAGLAHERKYYQTDDFPNDRWRLSDLTKQTSADERPNSAFEMINPKTGDKYPYNPKRVWAVSKDTFEDYYQKGKIVFPGEYDFLKISIPAYRVFESEDKAKALKKYGSEDTVKAISTHFFKDIGMSEDGNKEMVELFGGKIFSFPKPTSFIKQLVASCTSDNDIILDFFAGSGTTAHAVAQLNAEDGGNRKWICIQLSEKCKPESEAAKAGYTTIADIAKERIRRASKKIADENKDKKLDLGFKVFKLKESNFKVWNTQIENVEQLEQQMIDFLDNVREGATTEDLLYELVLKSGHELNVPIEEKKADGQSYFRIPAYATQSGATADRGDGMIVICLADKMTKPLFEAIAKDKPEKIITLDRVFGNNDCLKTNIMLQAEHAGVKEFKVI